MNFNIQLTFIFHISFTVPVSWLNSLKNHSKSKCSVQSVIMTLNCVKLEHSKRLNFIMFAFIHVCAGYHPWDKFFTHHWDDLLIHNYITWLQGWHARILAPRWHENPSSLCHPIPKAEGDLTCQGILVT